MSRKTNTESGLNKGVEGLQKQNFRNISEHSVTYRRAVEESLLAPIILADPFELTKMLDISPGLSEMKGTGDMLKLYYPKKGVR